MCCRGDYQQHRIQVCAWNVAEAIERYGRFRGDDEKAEFGAESVNQVNQGQFTYFSQIPIDTI